MFPVFIFGKAVFCSKLITFPWSLAQFTITTRRLEETGQAPAGWSFDKADWWLEEHGLIMEKPEPLPPGNWAMWKHPIG